MSGTSTSSPAPLETPGYPGIMNIFFLAIKEGNFVNNYNIVAVDLQDAIVKSKKYCEQSGTKRRFIHVRPFILGLEEKIGDENNPLLSSLLSSTLCTNSG